MILYVGFVSTSIGYFFKSYSFFTVGYRILKELDTA